MTAQIITLAQIWMAIAAEGYRLMPMTCYYERGAPSVCWMALYRPHDYSRGWLTIQVVGAEILIAEHSPEGQ